MGFIVGKQVLPVEKKVRKKVEYVNVATEKPVEAVEEVREEAVEAESPAVEAVAPVVEAEEPVEAAKPARKFSRKKRGGK